MEHNLVIGRMVHYALDTSSQNPGQCRPAMITRLWVKGDESAALQMTVFADGGNDYHGMPDGHARWMTSIVKDQLGEGADGTKLAACTPRSWHWPDECPRAD